MNKFKFRVYNNRRNSILNYTLTKTPEGWHIEHIAINGDCKPDGDRFFYMNFEQDSIKYPSGFGLYLGHIWEKLDADPAGHGEAQKMLQELADWVSACEKSRPIWKGWNG